MQYVRLCKSVADKGILIPRDRVSEFVDDKNDWYASPYYYNEEQFKQFQETGSVKGIENVTTDKLWFDFDNANDPDLARKDAATLLKRLSDTPALSGNAKDVEVYFSGNKGFHLVLNLNKELTPDTIKLLAAQLGKDLPTMDLSVYNPARILRVPGTKHQKSGLYKVPVPHEWLSPEVMLTGIKVYAKDLDGASNQEWDWGSFYINETLLPKPEIVKPEISKTGPLNIRSLQTPLGWKAYKWAIAQGYFGDAPGERHHAMMILASTCRGMGFDKESTYYLCKSALKKQAARTGRDEFPKEELWNNIIEDSVFSDNWQGGQYSPKNDPWLKNYCEKMGFNTNEGDDKNTTDITEAFGHFKHYAENIDELTVKTGITELDNKLRMTVGMSVGLVASPGSGKTSIAIQMLNNMSKAGHRCLFFSYDMYSAMVYQKLVQKHFKLSSDDIFDRFKTGDKKFQNEVLERIKSEYKNVDFCFRPGQTVIDIMDTIKESEDKSGEKVKFLVMDYNELVITDQSDSTASSSFVAQKMREFANVNQMCVLSLFQPNKMAGSPADDIKSYRSAKGSSAIEQSVSVMLGMSRPGFNPKIPEEDIFATISCLKNRMGPIFSLDLHWDGLTGSVRGLSGEQREMLEAIRNSKLEQSKGEGGWS